MVIYNQLDVTSVNTGSTTTYNEILNLKVTRTAGFQTGEFSTVLKNVAGQNASTFSAGDTVKIYVDNQTPPTGNLIFQGRVNQVFYESLPTNENIMLLGKDFNADLLDVTANEIFTGLLPGSIVKSLAAEYLSGITTTGVQDGTGSINTVVFKRRTVFDAIQEVAGYENYEFFVDQNKDLVFRPQNTALTGSFLSGNMMVEASFQQNSQDLYNRVWCYGGRQLTGYTESFTGDGAGSIFTLLDKPHNTAVYVSGAIKQGFIFEVASASQPESGAQYLVDYDQKRIIFTSGTAQGFNVPGSLVTVRVDYDRSRPIVKLSQDDASVARHGVKEKVIVNEEIDDPNQARDLTRNTLETSKDPKIVGRVRTEGIVGFNPGDVVTVWSPFHNITGAQMRVNQVDYDINPLSRQSEQHLTLSLTDSFQKNIDAMDAVAQIIKDLKHAQAAQVETNAIVTRLVHTTETLQPVARVSVIKNFTIDNALVLDHPLNGLLDTDPLVLDGAVGALNYKRVHWWNDVVHEVFDSQRFNDSGNTTATWDTTNRMVTF